MYIASIDPYSDIFITGDGFMTFTTFEPVGDDVFRAEGTFEATLVFVAEYTGEPDPDRTMTVMGSFVIESLPKD